MSYHRLFFNFRGHRNRLEFFTKNVGTIAIEQLFFIYTDADRIFDLFRLVQDVLTTAHLIFLHLHPRSQFLFLWIVLLIRRCNDFFKNLFIAAADILTKILIKLIDEFSVRKFKLVFGRFLKFILKCCWTLIQTKGTLTADSGLIKNIRN